MKIVCRLLVAMAILTVGLVQVSLAAEFNDLASAYHRVEQMRARRLATELSRLSAHAVDAQHLELTQLSIDQSKGLVLREVKSGAERPLTQLCGE